MNLLSVEKEPDSKVRVRKERDRDSIKNRPEEENVDEVNPD